MDLYKKIAILNKAYNIYDNFSTGLDVACKKSCAHCCTRNVTLTTIEAYKIIDYMVLNKKLKLFKKVKAESDMERFHPEITTNRLAMLCIKGEKIPVEKESGTLIKCPLLIDDECPVYPVRPFGCRCFVSKQPCSEIGYADVDPFVLSVNNLFLQFIEHVDSDGYTGNLTDLLLSISFGEEGLHSEICIKKQKKNLLVHNMPITVLMIPPEHRQRIEPVVEALKKIKV